MKRLGIAVLALSLCAAAWGQDSLNVRRAALFQGNWNGNVTGVAIADTLAYAVAGETLHIIDVAHPEAPNVVGSCPVQGTCLAVAGAYAYVAGVRRLTTVDISNPAAPVVVGSAFEPAGSDNRSSWEVTVAGNRAYVVANSWSEGEDDQYLSVYNTENVAQPTHLGNRGCVILYGAAVSGEHLYLAQADIGLTISTVEDPFHSIGGTWSLHPLQVGVVGDLAYMSGGDSVFQVVNIANPSAPEVVGSCSIGAYCGCHQAMYGNLVFVADPYGGGLRVVNVDDTSLPEETGYYRPVPGTTHMAGVAALGTTAYVAQDSVLAIYDCSEATGVTPNARLDVPAAFDLKPCYPNPFNPQTEIRFDVQRASRVNVQVFDIEGRLVKTLATRVFEPGSHRLTFDASGYASGIYVVRMQGEGFEAAQKVMLLK